MSEQQHRWSGQNVAGRYLLGNYLGGTDHGSVFATEIVHARAQNAAIKVIPAAGLDSDRQLARWKRAAALSHTNLLKILDYGKCELEGAGYLFVVSEFADEDLGDILPQRALNAEETRGMIEPVIETLAFLHQQGWAHTRVHPGNVLALGDQIKLSSDSIAPMDEMLGIAAKAEGFAAPEWGSVGATAAQDVWSLGASVVAAMTQKPPAFREAGGLELGVEIPEPLAGIAREALKTEPAQRITIAGIRAKLNPASVPVIAAKEPETQPEKKAAGVAPTIDPLKVPLSVVAPPPMSESRPQVPPIPLRRPAAQQGPQKKSYWMPVGAAFVVAVLLFAVLKLYRPQSDAATTQPASTAAPMAKSSAPSVVASSREPVPSSKRKGTPDSTMRDIAPPPTTAEIVPHSKPTNKSDSPATKGDVLDQVLPDVSEKARGTIQGRVRVSVRIHVNAAGTVDSAELETSSSSKYFAAQAIKASKKWQFAAPELGGRSVESDWLLHFEITSTATNVTSKQVSP
jgi:TonB family protein